MHNGENLNSDQVLSKTPVPQEGAESSRSILMRMVKKFVRNKSAVDKQFEESVRALAVWEKECEDRIAQKEEAIRNRYDSIDVELESQSCEEHTRLKRDQQKADDLALAAEIDRELGADV